MLPKRCHFATQIAEDSAVKPFARGLLLFPLAAGLLILNKFVQKICFLPSGRFTLSEVCGLSDMRCRGVATGQLQYSGWVSDLQGELCSFEYS